MPSGDYDFADPRRFGPGFTSHPGPELLDRFPEPSASRRQRKPAAARQTYLIAAEGSPLVKIGQALHPSKRLQSLQTGQPAKLSLVWTHEGDFEDALHRRFAVHRVRGEWFDLTPYGDPVAAVEAAIEEENRTAQAD